MAVSNRATGGDDSDPIAYAFPWEQKLLVKRQVRSARYMSAGSLLLGAASVAMMCRVVAHTGSQGSTRELDGDSLIGLSSAGSIDLAALNARKPGWYRTYLQGVIRRDMRADSEVLQALPDDSLVYVDRIVGRRAHLLQPVDGWMPMETEDGIEVMHADGTYRGDPGNVDLREILRSRKMREANQRLQESGIEMTAVEKKLLDALKKLRVDGGSLHRFGDHIHEKSQNLVEKAPQIGEKLAAKAARAFRGPTHPVDALIQKVRDSPHIKKIVDTSKVEEVLVPAMQEASSAREELTRTRESVAEFEDSLAGSSDEEFATQIGRADV